MSNLRRFGAPGRSMTTERFINQASAALDNLRHIGVRLNA
jgi:hypothetical protein